MSSFYTRIKGVANRLVDTFKNPSQIAIQAKTRVDEGGGSFSETWATSATIDAVIYPTSASEAIEAQRLNVKTSHTLYYKAEDYSTLSNADRIVFESRNFNVQAVINPGEADAAYKAFLLEGAAT